MFTRPVDVDHLRVETESGVEYEDIIVGEGPAVAEGEAIVIDYVGFLDDGTQFDSSVDRGVPIEIVFGEAPIAGWNEGIDGMQAGGKRRMQLPPELAYGEAGIPGLVPENATLTFEIDLLEIKPAPEVKPVEE
jgi:FKBP-type peptidyl-prolyl cis-trans isomerase